VPNIRLVTLIKCITVYSWPKIAEDLTRKCKQSAMKMETKRQGVVKSSELQSRVISRIAMKLQNLDQIYSH